MPYHVEKKGEGPRPYKVVKSDTGETVGSSETRKNAEASVRARYANETPKPKSK